MCVCFFFYIYFTIFMLLMSMGGTDKDWTKDILIYFILF